MARIRTIKPEFWKHEDLSALPEATHILAAALLNHADDEGFFNANPGLVKAECSPLRDPSVSIQDSLLSLHRIGFITLGAGTDGKRYGRIAKFDEHQVVNRPSRSKIKAIGIVWEDSPKPHGIVSESSVPEGNREQGTEGNRDTSSLRSDSSSASAADQPFSNQVEKPEAGKDPALKLTAPPADITAAKAERLRQVTADAIGAFNAILGKPNGLLPSVSPKVGRSRREQQVKRCIKVARDICADLYGSSLVTRGFWDAYFGQCAEDPFKSGQQGGGPGHESWQPTFEYLTREAVMLGVFEKATSGAEAA